MAEKEGFQHKEGKSSVKKENGNISETEKREQETLEKQLSQIKHKVIVLSGKGGVGKSTVAVNLATAASMAGKSAGLMDIDIHGPTTPAMLGLTGKMARAFQSTIYPLETAWGLKVISMGILLKNKATAVIWRGPMKMGVIRQFIRDTQWGDMDYLFVDCPPGTGDEPLTIAQLLGKSCPAVIVGSPQNVVIDAVRKSITFCRKVGLPILGLIENMSNLHCPHCQKEIELYSKDRVKELAEEENIPFLGAIPISPETAASADTGRPIVLDSENNAGEILRQIFTRMDDVIGDRGM